MRAFGFSFADDDDAAEMIEIVRPLTPRLASHNGNLMWRNVELRELRAFLILAKERHFGRSAERLGVTQSRVSQLIRGLEVKLGESLFERTSRHVRLTEAGAALLDEVRGPLDELSSALARADRDGDAPKSPLRLRLFSAPSAGPHLAEIIKVFERHHPQIPVQVSDSLDWRDPLGELLRGEVDLMAARLPLRRRDVTIGPILARDERVVAVADGHPLALREKVTLEDVAAYEVARLDTELQDVAEDLAPLRTPAGATIRRSSTVPPPRNFTELFASVAQGKIVHPTVRSLFDYMAFPGVVFVPLVGLPPSLCALVWRRASRDHRVRAFVDVARSVLDGADQAAV